MHRMMTHSVDVIAREAWPIAHVAAGLKSCRGHRGMERWKWWMWTGQKRHSVASALPMLRMPTRMTPMMLIVMLMWLTAVTECERRKQPMTAVALPMQVVAQQRRRLVEHQREGRKRKASLVLVLLLLTMTTCRNIDGAERVAADVRPLLM